MPSIGLMGGSQLLLTSEEIAVEPLKWLKYLVMDRVGLESIETIGEQVRRFRISTALLAKRWIQETFATLPPSRGNMVVLKVVPWDTGAQLRNYRILGDSDIAASFDSLLETYKGLDHELWCCQSFVAQKGTNLGGRITFPLPGRDQVLELVWYASPRLIETVSLPNFDHPYLRATRRQLVTSFTIEAFHIPSSEDLKGRAPFLEDFRWVACELSTRFQSMQLLAEIMRDAGAREVCFCFKVSDGLLTVIDWDTELESSGQERTE
jgi:hypothetical protein